ncbi:MAG: helix-turn-helix domain-containing protein [Pseudomonadota bacterium]
MKIDLEQWRELASPFYEVFPKEATEQAGVDIDVQERDHLFLSKVASPRQVLVHNPSTNKQACHDYLLFERFYAGGGKGEVGDTGFTVTPDRMHLIDMSQRYVSDKERSLSHGVCIPHAALGYVPGEQPAFASLALNSAKGRLLAAAHAELLNAGSDPNRNDSETLVQAFIVLIKQLMLGQDTEETRSLGRELPMQLLLRDYIAANLQRPDLSARHLEDGFGLSRATLYRHFAAEGGIARYIRNRRLDRCFFELAGAQPVRGQVAAVARRWHFTDASQFNRLYRQRFGTSPSDTLSPTQKPPATGAPPHQARIVQNWMDKFQTR